MVQIAPKLHVLGFTEVETAFPSSSASASASSRDSRTDVEIAGVNGMDDDCRGVNGYNEPVGAVSIIEEMLGKVPRGHCSVFHALTPLLHISTLHILIV